jgi:hypothetical protein
MANQRIDQLNSETTPAAADLLPIYSISGSDTKKITVSGLISSGVALISDASIPVSKINLSGISGTNLTDGTVTIVKLDTSTIPVASGLTATGGLLGLVAPTSPIQRNGSTGSLEHAASTVASGVHTKITVDSKGHVTSGTTLSAVDIPLATTVAVGGISVGTGLSVTGAGVLNHSNSTTSGTTNGVTIDAQGHVTGIVALVSSNLPVATTGVPGAVSPGTGTSVNGAGALSVTAATSSALGGVIAGSDFAVSTGTISLATQAGLTAGSYPKVTVTTKGIITAGATLEATDIPNLDASKITTGSLDIARVASNTVTGAKLANYAITKIGDTQPTADQIGQFFFNPLSRDLFLWDGNVFQPIGISVGEIVFAGTFDASAGGGTGQVASVTAEGTAIGLVEGSPLPAAATANNRYYLVVSESGTITSGNAPNVALAPPDIVLSTGIEWTEVDVSQTFTSVSASQVAFTPEGTIAANNVQAAIQEVNNEKLGIAGGTVTGNLEIGTAGSLSFEGSTANNFETTLAVVDPTADRTITLPDATGTVITTGDTGTVTSTMLLDGTILDADINASAAIVDTKLATIATAGKVSNSATTATNANTASAIVARDASGNFTAGTITANLTGTASAIADNSVTSAKIVDGTIVNVDIAAAAEIAVSKLADGTARQLLQTDAAGTGVEWTDNVDVPGTLDVTGAATFDAIAVFAAGSAGSPSLTIAGDTDTGIYSPGANQLAISSSGTERLRFNSAGALGVGGANFGTAGQALISNGSAAVPTWQDISAAVPAWQDLNTAVFGWDHDNDAYGLYLPGTGISAGPLSGTINIDVQSRIRRCVINNSGVVQYYLDANNSANKSADWLRIVETESLATAYTGAPAAEATNSLLRVGVPAWAAGTFTRGQRVTNGGYLWECVAASSTATPAAGAVASVLNGTDGQVVVEIPAFSVRYGFVNGVHTREVRLGCNDGLIAQGFRPHAAFIKTDGTYKTAFYWGAYQAYSDGTNLASVSGQTNTRSLTRATFRTRAALRGTGWHVQSYLELAAIQTLLVTEYRDYNSQKVLGNGSIEGSVYGVSTGLSNSRGNRSGNVYTVGGSSSDFMSYRGIENLYGRAWTWADGINVYERAVYLTNNQSVFADDTSVGYSFYAQVPSASGSYQKELFPLADVFLPYVVSGGSSTTYLADGLWTNSGWRVAYVGGNSNYGSIDGAFCLSLSDDSGKAGADIGARSAYAAN